MRWVAQHIAAMSLLASGILGAKSAVAVERVRELDSPSDVEGWIEAHVIYTPDPVSEVLCPPTGMLSAASSEGCCHGDADDIAVLTAALGLAAGLDAQYVVVAFDGRSEPSHVFTRLKRPEEDWGEDPLIDKPFADRATYCEGFPVEREK